MMANKSMGRDLEAQTSLKRGALNLRHARDAFAERHARSPTFAPPTWCPGRRLGTAIRRPPRAILVPDVVDGEEVFDPRM